MSYFNDRGFVTIQFRTKKSHVAMKFGVHEDALSEEVIEELEEAVVPEGMVEAVTGLKPVANSAVVVFKGMKKSKKKAKLF